jgi:adenylate cyclase class IV
MIEIEKKIKMVPALLKHLVQYGTCIGKKSIKDTYFDTADYRYTTQNIWLRERNLGFFELKRLIKGSNRTIDCYEEISDWNRILNILSIPDGDDPISTLTQAGLIPFASFMTHREKYQLSPFTIDVDSADFGDFLYQIAEIELIVEEEEEMHRAELAIQAFLKQFHIDLEDRPPAKLTTYLLQSKPDHYHALREAGVV